jgi:hypothetical protein
VVHPQIAAFARLADGPAVPARKIEGAKTLLGRTMHSIEYDAIHDELSVPVPFGGAILTFRGGANGEEPPIRVIQGSLTRLEAPDRLGIDPANNEIFVPEGKKVLVFPREASGNVAPIRTLEGPQTRLGGGFTAGVGVIGIDAIRNLIVAGSGIGQGDNGRLQLLIFDRKASGDTKPMRNITGPNTMLTNLGGPFTMYPPKGKIIVPIRGAVTVNKTMAVDSFVGVYDINADGDVPPELILGGPRGVFQMIRGVAVNARHKELIVSDKRINAVLTFRLPELFQ